MGSTAPTPRTTVRRHADRGRYEREVVDAILDEGVICHLGVVVDGQPVVLPTAYGRDGDRLYLHGAAGNASLRAVAAGAPACVTVTLLDGLVLARSTFSSSMNYRSVVLFATGQRVDDEAEKRAALDVVTDHVVPGRTADARPPSDAELRATLVVRLPLDEASAKVRTGGPSDDPADLGLDVWAGVVPLRVVAGPVVPDPAMAPATAAAVPAYVRAWPRPGGDGAGAVGRPGAGAPPT